MPGLIIYHTLYIFVLYIYIIVVAMAEIPPFENDSVMSQLGFRSRLHNEKTSWRDIVSATSVLVVFCAYFRVRDDAITEIKSFSWVDELSRDFSFYFRRGNGAMHFALLSTFVSAVNGLDILRLVLELHGTEGTNAARQCLI